jgi:hypothetical protein
MPRQITSQLNRRDPEPLKHFPLRLNFPHFWTLLCNEIGLPLSSNVYR